MNYEQIGNFISELRKEKGFTQKTLASHLSLTDKAISKWERGLGCPDISVLEDLSKTLDVSILEILKGRRIDKEIDKSKSNKYIMHTINYSKNNIERKYKNIISTILSLVIIGITSILLFLNFYHINYLKNFQIYDFDNDTFLEKAKNNLKTIEVNINKIKLLNLKYTKEENGQLLNFIEESYNEYINNPLLKYTGKIKFTINDLFVLTYVNKNEIINIHNSYKILEKYDIKYKRYKEHYETGISSKALSSANLYHEPYYSYKYNISFNKEDLNNFDVQAHIFNLIYNIEELLILTENIIEAGEVNE